MHIEPLLTGGRMKFDTSLLAVTDPVAVMLANPSAADDVIKGCCPASALSTCSANQVRIYRINFILEIVYARLY